MYTKMYSIFDKCTFILDVYTGFDEHIYTCREVLPIAILSKFWSLFTYIYLLLLTNFQSNIGKYLYFNSWGLGTCSKLYKHFCQGQVLKRQGTFVLGNYPSSLIWYYTSSDNIFYPSFDTCSLSTILEEKIILIFM